ncbi:MAG: MBL fold metallo-hydrolase [Chloroflexota bacterium]
MARSGCATIGPAELVAEGLRLTYVGHATVLIELDGVRILTDPVLGDRLGPLRRLGPTPDPMEIGDIDGILISHGHPDHLHRASIRAVRGRPLVIAPEGLGGRAGGSDRRVREVAVDDRVEIGGVRIIAVPARHGRWPLHPRSRPIGYLIEGSSGVYFAGDTALHPTMARLAGRVDVALLPVGRWGPPIGPERLTPASAVEAATRVGARTAIPIHWGTLHLPGFAAGRWGWGSLDAGDAFSAEAADRAPDLDIIVLQPGQTTDLETRSRVGLKP